MGARHATDRSGDLMERYGELSGEELLRPLIEREFVGRIALLSSFGTESALLLDMVAAIDRSLPVFCIDTGKLFPETIAYRDRLIDRLGLTDVRILAPSGASVGNADPRGDLWMRDPDACCALRKVAPYQAARLGFDCLISGRKRHHGGLRAFLPAFEVDGDVVKVDPLVSWDRARITASFRERSLPRHPLEAAGYLSVGCQPCTGLPVSAPDFRSGRWTGIEKTECGIHNGRRLAAAEATNG